MRNKTTLLLSHVVALMFLAISLPASATLVAETDGFPGNTNFGMAPDSGVFSGDLSFSFTTDANDYVFNSVTLILGAGAGGGTPGGFGVILGEDNSGTPGTGLELLAGSNDPTGFDAPYTYSGSSTLTANTTYWITLFDSGDNFYDFNTVSTTNESAGSVWSIGDDVYSSVSGFQNVAGPFTSQFDATVIPSGVPEPASATLFLVGLMGLLLRPTLNQAHRLNLFEKR